MKNRFIFFARLYCLAGLPIISANAQSELRGWVWDQRQAMPLPYAAVTLLSAADSALVAGEVADAHGEYLLRDIAPGRYLLSASALGYASVFVGPLNLFANRPPLLLDTLMLSESAALLEEVEVVARRRQYERHADRTVINVEERIAAAGGSALDILEKSPGIYVNRQNNTLTINGKEGAVILINGKQSRMPAQAVLEMLGGMNGANIAKIELIHSPPAHLDAEGDAGVINIVLKKREDFGLNGAFSLNAGHGRGDKLGGSFSFNLRDEKFDLFGDYSYLRNNTRQFFFNSRQIEFAGLRTVTSSDSEREALIRNHNARLGLDYQVGPKTSIGALVAAYDNHWNMDAVNLVRYTEGDTPPDRLRIDNSEINHWRHGMGNFHIAHSPGANQKLSVDLDYLHYFDNNPSRYHNFPLSESPRFVEEDALRVEKRTPIDIWVFKADYSRKMGERWQFDAGLKGAFSRFSNRVLVERLIDEQWVVDPRFAQNARLSENIAALYTSMEARPLARTRLTMGLRYEYTFTDFNDTEQPPPLRRRYGSFFPNIQISRELGESQTFQLAYNRRISRPTYNDLAPFIIFFDPSTSLSGNANLLPSLTDALRADYKLLQYALSLQYSRDRNAIARFQIVVDPENNTQTMSATNLDERYTTALSLSIPVFLFKWWEMRNHITGVHQRIRTIYQERPLNFALESIQFQSINTVQLPSRLALEVSVSYQSRALFGIINMRALSALNIGVQKRFADGQGRLSLTIDDVWGANYWRVAVSQPALHIQTEANFNWETRVVRLTYNRAFGNTGAVTRNRRTASEEERQRVQ
jgi:hypothetical protein